MASEPPRRKPCSRQTSGHRLWQRRWESQSPLDCRQGTPGDVAPMRLYCASVAFGPAREESLAQPPTTLRCPVRKWAGPSSGHVPTPGFQTRRARASNLSLHTGEARGDKRLALLCAPEPQGALTSGRATHTAPTGHPPRGVSMGDPAAAQMRPGTLRGPSVPTSAVTRGPEHPPVSAYVVSCERGLACGARPR